MDLTAFAQTNIAQRLRAAAQRGALGHALIFSGAGDRLAAAQYAAAALECTNEGERPCLQCAGCRKVLAGIHPDVTFVRDPEHKDLSADTIRAMRSDAFIRPNEGERKVYLFEDCSLLTERDQNILLKTVEEGPPYAAFLFCAENSAALLQTVRSRCVEYKLGGGDAEAAEGERAAALCRLTAEGSAAERAAFLTRLELEKPGREDLAALFAGSRVLFAEALKALYGAADGEDDAARRALKSLGRDKLMSALRLLEDYRFSCTYNVGVGPVLGGFAADWERVCGT